MPRAGVVREAVFSAPERPFRAPKGAEEGSPRRGSILLKREWSARERKQGARRGRDRGGKAGPQ